MIRLVALVAFVVMLAVLPVRAQTGAAPPQDEQPEEAGEDNPIKAVFFSVRDEYGNLRGDDWNNAWLFRSDRAWLRQHDRLGGKVGLLTRADVPIITAHTDGASHTGLGDLYVQIVHVPWLTRHFALAMGSGLTMPTATSQTLGRGKWQLAPLVTPVWFFPQGKGFVYIRVQEHVSFAGDTGRPDVNYLETAPTGVYNFRRGWWVLLDTVASADWTHDNRVSFRSGVELGHVVFARRFGLSVKPEIPWGVNRTGDWALKVILTRYRLPSSS